MRSLRTTDQLPAAPANLEVEGAVLCACLLDQEQAEEFLDLLQPAHFHRTAHQLVFGAITRLRGAGNPVDLPTVVDELRRTGELEKAGGGAYVAKLVDSPPATDPAHYAERLIDAHSRRRMLEIANTMVKGAHRPEVAAADLLSNAQASLADLEDGHGRACAESLRGLCFDATDRYETLQSAAGRIVGVPTGFHDLDLLTCGLHPGELVILAGRPSMGKTALALNMARHAAGEGHPAGFFSMEMSKRALVDRLISTEAGVNGLKFRNGRFDRVDWEKITAAQDILHDLPAFIDDTPGLHYAELWRRARRLQREHGAKIIFIDYLQLMAGDKQNGRVEEVGSISRALKGIARELNIPVVCLSQLSRACEARDNKRPRLSDLRDSGAIEQDADVVVFIYRDEVYNREASNTGLAELEVAKQRNGPTGTVFLRFHGRTTKFSNCPPQKGA